LAISFKSSKKIESKGCVLAKYCEGKLTFHIFESSYTYVKSLNLEVQSTEIEQNGLNKICIWGLLSIIIE
jgi:hypothetical protein